VLSPTLIFAVVGVITNNNLNKQFWRCKLFNVKKYFLHHIPNMGTFFAVVGVITNINLIKKITIVATIFLELNIKR
jgi:hypothetical protein